MNHSFVEESNMLRARGIRNHDFMLKTINPDLIGVDPHDPDLTGEQMTAIIEECKVNMWYFLRECVRVPEIDSDTFISMTLHQSTLAMLYCFEKGIDTWVTHSRATYHTWTTLAASLWASTFVNSPVCLWTKAHGPVIRRISKHLPVFLHYVVEKSSNQANYLSIRSNVHATEAAQNPIGTVQLFGDAEFSSLLQVYLKAYNRTKRSKKESLHYARIFDSTVNRNLHIESPELLEFISSLPEWNNIYYDADSFLTEIPFIHIQFNFLELGFGGDWFDMVCESLMNNPHKIKGEILLERN